MRTNGGASRRGASAKYVAVGWIVLLELFAAVYLYANPIGGASKNPIIIPTSATTTSKTTSTSTTSTTSSTTKVGDRISVESAIISNDTLMMKVHNLGPNTTKLLTVADLCTPKFQVCYNYKTMAGAYFAMTFALPAKKTFMANLTGVCVIPIPSCKSYLPTANMTYYFQVKFSFVDGSTALVPVSAKANNTWTKYLTAIMGISSPSLIVFPANLTGSLSVTLALNDSLPYASFSTWLDGYLKPSSAYSGKLLINETGCMGSLPEANFTSDGHHLSVNFTGDCSQPITVTVSFTTVLTGISSGPYYALVVRDTTDIDKPAGYPDNDPGHYTTFALWVQGSTK